MSQSCEQTWPPVADTEPLPGLSNRCRVTLGMGLNDADTVWLLLMVKPQPPVPLQAPPQPSNRLPFLFAVRLIRVPESTVTLHVPGQLMPVPVTEPPPLTETVSVTRATN